MKTFKPLLFCILSSVSILVFAQDSQDTTEQNEDSTEYLDYEVEESYYEEDDEFEKSYFKNYDSGAVELRAFDTTAVNRFKNDPEFQYGYTQASMSLWDAFWLWVAQQIGDLYSDSTGADWDDFILYAFGIAVIAYVIIRLLKLDGLKILYGRNEKKKIDHLVLDENIHEMDFEKLLDDAVQSRNYRLAVRLYFLYGLKMLADKHHVYWEPGKTSHEYISEINAAELKPDFRKLNYYFEYTWYGNFAVSDELFTTVKNLFTSWKTKI